MRAQFRPLRLLPLAVGLSLLLNLVPTRATLLYSASLRNGDYGGGFMVDTFSSCSDPDGSSCTDGDYSNLGIVDGPDGVTYTNSDAVINYSLGRDGKGGFKQSGFRTHGTVSVSFRADLQDHADGQPFVDNYGFNQFRSGQATFGTSLVRSLGADGVRGTADDRVSLGWSTWHNNVWYPHVSTPVLMTYDEWHDLGLAWGGPDNDFEVWIDGMLVATHNLPGSVPKTWGSNLLGLGSAYNFALGEIHERIISNGTSYGITFADLEIWDEYRPFGATNAPGGGVPEPATLGLLAIGLLLLGNRAGHRRA